MSMTELIRQSVFIYALTIVISMLVAWVIIILNKVIFCFEDAHRRHSEAKASATNGKAA